VTETSERAVIRQLEDRRYAAIVRGDYDAFRELCHPDLAYTHSTGISDSLDRLPGEVHPGLL
jgi:ketosteroid isomerase-like protein